MHYHLPRLADDIGVHPVLEILVKAVQGPGPLLLCRDLVPAAVQTQGRLIQPSRIQIRLRLEQGVDQRVAAVRIPEGNAEIFSGKHGHDPVPAGDPVDPAVINGNELLVLLADDGKVVFVKADRKSWVASQDLIQHR